MPAKTIKLESDDAPADRTPTPSLSPIPTSSPKSSKKRPSESPSTPTTKKTRKTPSTPTIPLDLSTPGWTAEKKSGIVDRLLAAGIASLGAANMAKEFNVDAKSMSNALAANRPGNIRDKAVKGARS